MYLNRYNNVDSRADKMKRNKVNSIYVAYAMI